MIIPENLGSINRSKTRHVNASSVIDSRRLCVTLTHLTAICTDLVQDRGGQRCVLETPFLFSFFFKTFLFFTLLVALSSSSLLPPHHSFLLAPPSSLLLFLPLPALSKSLRIDKRPFFIAFDKSVTDQPTDQPTNRQTDKASYRDARPRLKTGDQRTDGRTDRRTHRRTNGRTDRLIEMRGRI